MKKLLNIIGIIGTLFRFANFIPKVLNPEGFK